jgi:hypothetical protein
MVGDSEEQAQVLQQNKAPREQEQIGSHHQHF